MSTLGTTSSSIFGTVTGAARTITNSLDTVSKSIDMVSNYVDLISEKQAVNHKIELATHKVISAERYAVDEATRKIEIDNFKDKSDKHATYYDNALKNITEHLEAKSS